MESIACSLHSKLPIVSSSLVEAPTSPRERQSTVEWIRTALAEVGCFVLRIEGAGPTIDAATRQWRQFYALPDSAKQICRAERDEGGGWMRLRDEPLYMSHMNASELDARRCKEQFGCEANTDIDTNTDTGSTPTRAPAYGRAKIRVPGFAATFLPAPIDWVNPRGGCSPASRRCSGRNRGFCVMNPAISVSTPIRAHYPTLEE
ncbi:MAG: hypothetical protein IH973_13655 [Myxococcales bacterium]|nr:hypothetical protein [Myxococcales bacterium]